MLTDESSLPRHVLVNSVLAYLDLYSLIKFSCTSKACRDVVFRDVSWRKIDVSGNNRITDEQLRAFLLNIDAGRNTRVLSVAGCPNIKGTGLEPLYGSTVMEDIDLRVLGSLPLLGESGKIRGPSGLSEDYVAEILRSMLPPFPGQHFVLRRVAIRPWRDDLASRYSNYGPAIGRFIRHHDSLRRSLPPSDPRNCDAPDSCYLCGVAGAVACDGCDGRFCRACAMPHDCAECGKRKCQWCGTIVTCAACGKRGCASHGYEGCGGCEVVFCRDCHVDLLDYDISRNEYYCAGCPPPYWGGNIR
jgi:hypothetical protein